MRNTWSTYLRDGNNPEKSGLMPDGPKETYVALGKGASASRVDGTAAHQLDGGVMAHRGYDG